MTRPASKTNATERLISNGKAFYLLVQAWCFCACLTKILGMLGAMFFRYVAHKVHGPDCLYWVGLIMGGATGFGLGVAVVHDIRRKLASPPGAR
jgi:hypothetical protein